MASRQKAAVIELRENVYVMITDDSEERARHEEMFLNQAVQAFNAARGEGSRYTQTPATQERRTGRFALKEITEALKRRKIEETEAIQRENEAKERQREVRRTNILALKQAMIQKERERETYLKNLEVQEKLKKDSEEVKRLHKVIKSMEKEKAQLEKERKEARKEANRAWELLETTLDAKAEAPKDELSGRCGVCQDNEANIAIITCGHLVLCRSCSSKILKSAQKRCPMCRTPIRREHLLEIYKA